jgi:hypothetical protein
MYAAGITYETDEISFTEAPYVIPSGYFALILSIVVYAERKALWGNLGNVTINLEVALRENPTNWYQVWVGVLCPVAHGRVSDGAVGQMAFLREGDQVRWYFHGDPIGGRIQTWGNAWLAQFLFQG